MALGRRSAHPEMSLCRITKHNVDTVILERSSNPRLVVFERTQYSPLTHILLITKATRPKRREHSTRDLNHVAFVISRMYVKPLKQLGNHTFRML